MSQLVEKVAKAMYNKWIETVTCCEETWNDLPKDHKLRLIESARSGIEAMKEPTPFMLSAGNQASEDNAYVEAQAYTAMIEAALKE